MIGRSADRSIDPFIRPSIHPYFIHVTVSRWCIKGIKGIKGTKGIKRTTADSAYMVIAPSPEDNDPRPLPPMPSIGSM